MNTFKMVIPDSSINKLLGNSTKDLLYPLMQDISNRIRTEIAYAGKRVRANNKTNPISISELDATSHSIKINKGYVVSTIYPIINTFFINKEGYSGDTYKYVDDWVGLDNWIIANVTDKDKVNRLLNNEIPLIVRGKNNPKNGRKPPLGAPERDVFKIGLDNFILNKSEFGLR